MTITEWLGRMRSMNGSDLFLTEGKSPRLRVDGRLILFEQEIVTQDDFLLFFND